MTFFFSHAFAQDFEANRAWELSHALMSSGCFERWPLVPPFDQGVNNDIDLTLWAQNLLDTALISKMLLHLHLHNYFNSRNIDHFISIRNIANDF